jgi:hypothetical protein
MLYWRYGRARNGFCYEAMVLYKQARCQPKLCGLCSEFFRAKRARWPPKLADMVRAQNFFRALLYPVGQLLNPVAHMNTCISTTTLLGSVVRVNRIRVEAPLEAVPLGTKCDQEGTL